MYDRDLTEASKGALLELCMALGHYKREFVLVGGWAPYFLTRQHFDHCGSIDIDFAVKPSIIPRYSTIKEVIEGLGYRVTGNPFRFERGLDTVSGRSFTIHLDLLTEPGPVLGQEFLVEVQEDLRACLIPGIGTVFDHCYEQELEATLPGGGEARHAVDVADIVGALATKGNALPRLKDKDSYDIYAVAGHHEGSPMRAAEQFNTLVRSKGSEGEPTIARALRNIQYGFSSPSRYGCFSVSRFIGSDGLIRSDAHQRVTAFMDNLTKEQ
ncbi:hypothetical protein A3K81_03310 [Candidatus Bathyarchaeota archaeon RBG_13_60_20]|nr:MAG: hypothetical protein A3K81_03310 [Candidatus Bathyarchaeota archaeon RBG_13_60_20]